MCSRLVLLRMKHLKKTRKFGRIRKVRAGFLKGLAASFFMEGKIATTEARAKELRPYVERFLTRARGGALADRDSVQKGREKVMALVARVFGIEPLGDAWLHVACCHLAGRSCFVDPSAPHP